MLRNGKARWSEARVALGPLGVRHFAEIGAYFPVSRFPTDGSRSDCWRVGERQFPGGTCIRGSPFHGARVMESLSRPEL